MNINICRSQASKWALAAEASSYERYGTNFFNFVVGDKNLRRWILRNTAEKTVYVPPQDLYWMNEVFITSSTLIYTAQGAPFEVSVADQPEIPPLTREAMASAPTIDAPVAFIFKAGSDNYGHFLIEMLPKLEHLLTLGITPIKLLVPTVSGYISRLLEKIVAEFFPRTFEFLFMENSIVRVREVLVPGPVTRHNAQKSAVVARFGERCKQKAAGLSLQSDSIYVSRSAIRNRSMTNEAEVEQLMRETGFLIVHPESMSFLDQVAIFSAAKRIVGPLGAGLSNILFSDAGTDVMMITPGMYDMFFYDLSCLCKQTFGWLFTERVEFSDTSRLHRDYQVDVSLIKQALKFNWG